MSDLEQESVEHLENIENELKEIKERTGGRWNSLRNGLWQGIGAVVGSIVALALLGFLLSLFGVFGFGEVKDYLQGVISSMPRR